MNFAAATIMSLLDLPREVLAEYLDLESVVSLSFTCTAAARTLAGICGRRCGEYRITFWSARGCEKVYLVFVGELIIPKCDYDQDVSIMGEFDISVYTNIAYRIVKYRGGDHVLATCARELVLCGAITDVRRSVGEVRWSSRRTHDLNACTPVKIGRATYLTIAE